MIKVFNTFPDIPMDYVGKVVTKQNAQEIFWFGKLRSKSKKVVSVLTGVEREEGDIVCD